MTQPTQHNMAHTPRRSQKMDKTSRILLISFAVVGLLLAFFAGRFVYNTVKAWQVTSLPGAPVGNLEGQPITENLPDLNIKSEIGPEPKLWDGKSRVNILFLGLDATNQRELMEPGPRFSDTMILVTIDPLTQSLGALSIRRDLWVNIPGYDYHKINKAHFLGEAQHLPGGGAGLAVATVENAVISNARRKYILCDSAKLGKKAVAKITKLSLCDGLITDQNNTDVTAKLSYITNVILA